MIAVRHLSRHDFARAEDIDVTETGTTLYVSATPSESAVGFYRSMGFAPTTEPDPRLFALEPKDIHMIMAL